VTHKTLGELRDEQVAAAYERGRVEERAVVVKYLSRLRRCRKTVVLDIEREAHIREADPAEWYATPEAQPGERSTSEYTPEEITIARAVDKLRVDADGLGWIRDMEPSAAERQGTALLGERKKT
jgi:hypothetical protein